MRLDQAYDRNEFVNFIVDFLPDDFEINETSISYSHGIIKSIVRLGKCTNSLKKIEVFEVTHSSISDARITLSREIFKYMRQNAIEYALVAFISENSKSVYRLSFITMAPKDNNGKLEFEHSNPKRFSFLLGENQHTRTPQNYLIDRGKIQSLDDLKNRFSIEVLTKDFYDELFKWYENAINVFVPYPPTDTKKEEHIIRLITRLMFVWFIKQKNLVPESLFDENELTSILKNFNPNDTTSSTYYNAILQNLFFATLNCEIEDRQFSSDSTESFRGYDNDYRIKTKYRDNNRQSYFIKSHEEIIKLFESVPFLNGGLFECLTREEDDSIPDDGFSRDKNKRAFVPNNIFFDKNTGIISIFKKYNWTIEENSPADIEVALDPELLGKVFENLLGTYNPETRETARKDSGSFYTPRQIVQYMTDESLTACLAKNIDGNNNKAYRLISSLDLPDDIKNDTEYCEKVVDVLQNIKVLDPACGSGAFPMGLLNRIVEIVCKIKPDINKYNLKLNLIENCIYGVDIQTIAIQISKLRCFISLICEQDRNNDKADNYGIHPLPNLETKFVAANTLVSLNKSVSDEMKFPDETLDKLKKDLYEIRVHQMIKVPSYKKKKDLRKKDKELCKQLTLFVFNRLATPNQERINMCQKEIEAKEKEKKNYIGSKYETITEKRFLFDALEPQQTFTIDVNKQKRDKLDSDIKRLYETIKKEKNKASSSQTEQEIRRLIEWDPYKPTVSSDFFDAHWMFNIQDGFDIVIGNPPYVQLQKLPEPIKTVYKNQQYMSFNSMGDLYCLFYERGIQLLKEKGILCYITSNKWMRAGYGEALRSFFLKCNPTLLIDLGANVFSSATVDTNILLVEKKGYDKKTLSCTLLDRQQEMSVFVRQNAIEMEYTKDAWAILNPIEQSIKAKIEKYGTPLKDWDISIYRGILTGCNEAFIISGEKRKELIAEDPKSDEIIRPILRGRDIKRYGYEFADLWLIATFPSKHYNIDDYPAVKKWLQSFGKKLEQTGEEYIDEYGKKQKCRKKTNNKWFETQDSIAYWNDFSRQKIMYSEIVYAPQFFLDKDGMFYPEATSFIMTGDKLEYLLIALHSKLLVYAFKTFYAGGGLGETGYRYKKAFLEKLPVYHVSDKEFETCKNMLNKKNFSEFEKFLSSVYKLSEEEITFVEKLS